MTQIFDSESDLKFLATYLAMTLLTLYCLYNYYYYTSYS